MLLCLLDAIGRTSILRRVLCEYVHVLASTIGDTTQGEYSFVREKNEDEAFSQRIRLMV